MAYSIHYTYNIGLSPLLFETFRLAFGAFRILLERPKNLNPRSNKHHFNLPAAHMDRRAKNNLEIFPYASYPSQVFY